MLSTGCTPLLSNYAKLVSDGDRLQAIQRSKLYPMLSFELQVFIYKIFQTFVQLYLKAFERFFRCMSCRE